MENKEFIIKPLNNNLNEDKNEWFICPIDCGTSDVCDDCDGVCRPKVK